VSTNDLRGLTGGDANVANYVRLQAFDLRRLAVMESMSKTSDRLSQVAAKESLRPQVKIGRYDGFDVAVGQHRVLTSDGTVHADNFEAKLLRLRQPVAVVMSGYYGSSSARNAIQ